MKSWIKNGCSFIVTYLVVAFCIWLCIDIFIAFAMDRTSLETAAEAARLNRLQDIWIYKYCVIIALSWPIGFRIIRFCKRKWLEFEAKKSIADGFAVLHKGDNQ